MEQKAFIYGIRNVIDNKIYIGSTKHLKRRKYEHFYKLKKNLHFNCYLQRAYNIDGADKFHFFQLEECTLINRKEREIFYINEYQSGDGKFGFNLNIPDENKFQCNQYTKDLIRDIHIASGRSKPVRVYTTDLQFVADFSSVKSCGRSLAIHDSIIHDILNGKRNRLTFKGFTFFRPNEIPYIRSSNMQRKMLQSRSF